MKDPPAVLTWPARQLGHGRLDVLRIGASATVLETGGHHIVGQWLRPGQRPWLVTTPLELLATIE